NMTAIVLEGPIAEAREREVRLLHDLGEKIGEFSSEDGPIDRQRLRQSAQDLSDMFFMVVIIGEFNAGKSSFVNALLGDEILPMGITPTTEVIELIKYHRTKSPQGTLKDSETFREWRHPNTGAPGVVIVDTPGTGSVFAKHEEIAKNFLSRSDLVIFLISAKRAFAQTEKMYLELARDYGKKIILVINQIDLLEDKEAREVSAFVRQQAKDLLNIEPPIFKVSAKEALKKKAGGLFSTSSQEAGGITAVRQHLLEIFQKTPPAKQKLLTQLDLGESMIKKYQTEITRRLDLVTNDERQARQLREELEKQASTLNAQLETSMQELDRVFDQIRQRGRAFIKDNLSLSGERFLSGGVDRDAIREKFEADVVGSALQQINDISEDYTSAVVDSSRRYWRSIIDRLNKLEALLEEQVTSPDAGSYSEQRLALQEAIAIADAELKSYRENNLGARLHNIFSTNMSGFTLSVVGVVGGIVAFVAGVAAPGALTATALGVGLGMIIGPAVMLGGGALAYRYWNRLRSAAYNELDERLDALRKSYRQALQDLTDRERSRLLQYGQQILAPVFSHLEVVAQNTREQQEALQNFQAEIIALRQNIETIEIVEGTSNHANSGN
ncbi:MAG: dynamin family protein, partial [Anaerolineales bacterium]